MLSYYLANYLYYADTIKTAIVFNDELNTTCVTEPFYWFTLNTQREMIWNPEKIITNETSFEVSKQSILEMYQQSNMLQEVISAL